MNIAKDVDSVFSPRVKMPSGGYLIFEQTEAMYVVDVNSGRYAAKKAQEENSLKTNLEAAREIAKQLRLRDIGGIIVVDFIDQRDENNRKKIYDELKREFKKDRAKTNVLPMSDFGLMQITRQRIRPSVVKSVSKVCPMCGGSGSVVTQNTILADIEGWLTKFRYSYNYRSVELSVNPFLYSYLTSGFISKRWRWMFSYRMYISIVKDETVSMNDYKFTLIGSDIDITDTVLMDEPIDEAFRKGENSQKLKDGTQLDVYHRDSGQKGKKGGKGKQSSGSPASDKQKDSTKPAPKKQEVKKQETKKQEAKKEKPEETEDRQESSGGGRSRKTGPKTPRKGKVSSKYYKQDRSRSGQAPAEKSGEQNKSSSEKTDKSPDSSTSKPSQKKSRDKESGSSDASEQSDQSIPNS